MVILLKLHFISMHLLTCLSQNDSTLNRHKTDTKRPAFTTLAFVDFLRPAFFVMESVPGFLQWRVSPGSSDEIKAGDLKLLLKLLPFSSPCSSSVPNNILHYNRILHFLGQEFSIFWLEWCPGANQKHRYNVMGQFMHARSFGVPQARDRFFTVATLPDWGPFRFPEPSHAFRTENHAGAKGYQLGPGLKLRPSTAPRKALHETLTVAEALSDLPLFDW